MESPLSLRTVPQQLGSKHQPPFSSSNKPWLRLKPKPKPKPNQLFRDYQLKPSKYKRKPSQSKSRSNKLKVNFQRRVEELYDIKPVRVVLRRLQISNPEARTFKVATRTTIRCLRDASTQTTTDLFDRQPQQRHQKETSPTEAQGQSPLSHSHITENRERSLSNSTIDLASNSSNSNGNTRSSSPEPTWEPIWERFDRMNQLLERLKENHRIQMDMLNSAAS